MIEELQEYLIERVYLPTRTLGSWYDTLGQLVCKTLELPWKNNERSISCIPEGTYLVTKEPAKESRPYPYFRLHNVPKRSGILVHRGQKPQHSKGCIIVGSRFTNVESMEPTLSESTVKLTWMTDNMPDRFYLTIREKKK